MMRTVASFVLAVVLGTVSSAAGEAAGWMERFEDFEGYPYDAWPGDGTKTLPAPWEDTRDMYAHNGIGYNGSARAPADREPAGQRGIPSGRQVTRSDPEQLWSPDSVFPAP